MPRALPGMSLDMNAENGLYALGYADGMFTEINTDRHMASVVKYSHTALGHAFNEHMDTMVLNTPFKYQHMYEWKSISEGHPSSGRLWTHVLKGRGSRREATFNFLLSRTPVPTAQERSARPGDPMSLVSSDDIAKLAEGGNKQYIFRNKARMMEFGITVTIEPINVNNLFIPTGNSSKPFMFKKFARTNPGGPESTGSFSSAWVQWWTTVAPAMWNEEVKKTIELGLGKTQREIAGGARKSRNKVVGLNTINSANAAYASGRDYAMAKIKRYGDTLAQAREYSDRYGEEFIDG